MNQPNFSPVLDSYFLANLDIETLSRPTDATVDGKIPIMTTFSFAAMPLTNNSLVIAGGVMDTANMISNDSFDVNENTLEWWESVGYISSKVRESQFNSWKNNTSKFFIVYGSGLGTVEYFDTMSELQGAWNSQVPRKNMHITGNGPEFDMSIFDMHFPNHKMYKFNEVGSARSFKSLYSLTEKSLAEISKEAADFARMCMENILGTNPRLREEFGLVPDYHDATFDTITELYQNKAIIKHFIK